MLLDFQILLPFSEILLPYNVCVPFRLPVFAGYEISMPFIVLFIH